MFYEIEEAGDPTVLPRLHQGRAAQMGAFPGVPDRAAAAVHPRGPARRHVAASSPAGPVTSTRASGSSSLSRLAPVKAEMVGPMPYPGSTRLRRAVSPRASPVLEGQLRQGADRRGDCRPCPARLRMRRPSARPCTFTRSTAPATAWRGTPPPSGIAMRISRWSRRLWTDAGRRRREHQMGARLLGRHGAPLRARGLHQLHGR